MDDIEIIKGTIDKYIYTANDSLYKVAAITTEDLKEVVIVGFFPLLDENLNYEFTGYYKEHSKYGKQFFVESYSKSKYNSEDGLISYLSSDKFKGIGPKTAEKIVEVIGPDLINKILADKSVLNEVPNLNQAKKDFIYETIKGNYVSEQVLIELYSFGLSAKMVYKMYEKYSINAANKIKENPYRLIYEVDGFGFRKSDVLALKMNIAYDDKRRIKEAIIYTLKTVCYQNGFTFLSSIQLINSATELLNKLSKDVLSKDVIESTLNEMATIGQIVKEDGRIFDKVLYQAEVRLANKIKLLLEKNKTDRNFSKEKIADAVLKSESEIKIQYTSSQKDAISRSLSEKMSVITGGPGTGKTTIIKGIIQSYAMLKNEKHLSETFQAKVLLSAPTGRAAKRMSEATGFKATTIHKALGYNYEGFFTADEKSPLYAELIIIDEASMIDIMLADSLFNAIPFNAKIIIVGDANQLPSVGPGNFLHDLIQSKILKVTRLNEILRQASNSDIIRLSHQILESRIDYSLFKLKKELFFYDSDTQGVSEKIITILDNFIASGGDLINDIQILIPIYASIAGIDYINNVIQNRYNKNTTFITRGERIFKIDDKVLQLVNRPEYDIMNGDIGVIKDIKKIDDNEYLYIEFDGRIIKYPANNIDELSLAYAISIHKSQGSEYKNVIMPVVGSYSIMLRQKIIYTAITRAKEKLIIVGKYNSILNAIKTPDTLRQTSLVVRLNAEKTTKVRIDDPNIPFDTLGEENMEDIDPYKFM